MTGKTLRPSTSGERARKGLRGLVVIPLIIAALGLSGCGASNFSGSASDSSYPKESAYTMDDFARETKDPGAQRVGSAPALDSAEAARDASAIESQVIVTGSLRLSVDDPLAASASAQEIVKNAGGRTDYASQSSTQTLSARATFRIPADAYEDTLAQLRELGSVTREEIHTEEVGAQIADLDARMAALKESIDRLMELMKSAASTADLLEAERELTSRQADLDSLRAQRAWYEDEVQYSTLEVEFSSSSVAPTPSIGAWERSWQIFTGGMEAIGYVLIILLPWIVLFAILLVLLRLILRRWKPARPRFLRKKDTGASFPLPGQGAAPSLGEVKDGAAKAPGASEIQTPQA